jgi:hypothetical protein
MEAMAQEPSSGNTQVRKSLRKIITHKSHLQDTSLVLQMF